MQITIIILLNLIIYYRSLFYEYVYDDLSIWRKTKQPAPIWYKRLWEELLGNSYYNALESHIMTLAIHIINACLIYWVLGGLFNNYEASFWTALLFSFHAVNSQCSIGLTGRRYSFVTTFVLLSFKLPFVAPLLWPVSHFFMVNGMLSPLAFIGTKYWYMAGTVLLCLFYAKRVVKAKKENRKGLSKEMEVLAWRKVIPAIKTYGYYFRLCLWPWKLGIHHNFLAGLGLNKRQNDEAYSFDLDFLIGITCLYIVITNILLNWCPASWGLLWFSVNIAMWLNIIPIHTRVGERYCYLANIGLMFALVNTLPLLWVQLYLIAHIVRFWYFMDFYKNEFWLRQYAIIEQKDSLRMWLLAGEAEYHEKNYKKALSYYCEAWKYYPQDFKLNFNCAMLWMLEGELGEAEELLKVAEQDIYDTDQKEQAQNYIKQARENIEIIKRDGGINMGRMFVIK